MRQQVLRPVDVVVALRLALVPGERYESLARAVGVSLSTAHQAVQRLKRAGLVAAGSRTVHPKALLEFVSHGARYAFFAEFGPESRGVPTGHSAPPLAAEIASDDVLVWPSAEGNARGASLVPLYDGASSLPERAPELYRALALVDALRVGCARERKLAVMHLEALLANGRRDPSAATSAPQDSEE